MHGSGMHKRIGSSRLHGRGVVAISKLTSTFTRERRSDLKGDARTFSLHNGMPSPIWLCSVSYGQCNDRHTMQTCFAAGLEKHRKESKPVV